ncbi:MAG TPA: family 43 glycosylhydrolase, partial [Acidimicrobiales bacterium]
MAIPRRAVSGTIPRRDRRVVVGLLAAAVVVTGTGLGLVLTGGPAAGGRAGPPAVGSRADPPLTTTVASGKDASDKETGDTGLAAVGALGAATGAAVPGTRSAYYEPPVVTPAEAASPGQFVVTGRDAPDPFALADDGTDYLYTSQGDQTGNNLPVADGPSLTELGPLRDAMPDLPAWAVPGFTWAPDVHRFGDRYVLYFTSIVAGTDPADQCIGIASGSSPLGPFTAEAQPFVCQLDQHGSIDPRTFTDVDGTTYLIWKSDDNADVNGTGL